jgi:hypothetical protein
MAEAKLKTHAEVMRQVLFPNEGPPESSDSQHLGPDKPNAKQPAIREEQMNESEMIAELERLRAEMPNSRRRRRAVSVSK